MMSVMYVMMGHEERDEQASMLGVIINEENDLHKIIREESRKPLSRTVASTPVQHR
jgi:hypothetical protein